jgi:hypothetical protein
MRRKSPFFFSYFLSCAAIFSMKKGGPDQALPPSNTMQLFCEAMLFSGHASKEISHRVLIYIAFQQPWLIWKHPLRGFLRRIGCLQNTAFS